MTLQEFCEKLFFEEETSDHERSILLVEIMMAIGFSKSEREIHRHRVHLRNVIENIFRTTGKDISKITGSASEGMCGGMYIGQSHNNFDFVLTARNIKLCTPRTNNVNNPPLLLRNDNGDYDASFFVEEEDNCPGYVKLLLAEMKTNCGFLGLCRRMNDDKRYLSNSNIKDSFYQNLVKLSKNFDRFSPPCQKMEINRPAHTIYKTDALGNIRKTDNVYCIHYDMWPNSANSFITRRKPNNWPSNIMLENIQSQRCDIAPVGHHDSKNNDIQWRISFPGELSLLLDLTDVQALCYALIKIILRKT